MATQGTCGPRKFAAQIDTRSYELTLPVGSPGIIHGNVDRMSISVQDATAAGLQLTNSTIPFTGVGLFAVQPSSFVTLEYDKQGPFVTGEIWVFQATGGVNSCFVTEVYFIPK